MRVVWIHNFPPNVVSAGVFMFSLAAELRRKGVLVDVHYTGSLKSVTGILAAQRQVSHLSRRYDLAHAQFGSACALVTSRARCRKVLSLRGTDLLGCDTGSWRHHLHGRAARWMTRLALSSYDHVLVMSQRMRDELCQFHGRAQGVDVLPSGIDLQRFRPLDRMESRKRLGYADDIRPWVLFATLLRTNPVKRPALAAAAFQRAAIRRPDLVLRTLSGVRHEEVPLWMNAADVLLLTSTREGWPNVVKEALACNVPFVSTDVSDLARIASVESGCVVAPADPDALADGILKAIETKPSDTLRRHVEQMALPTVADKLHAVYDAVMSRKLKAAA